MSWEKVASKGLEIADKYMASLKWPSFVAMLIGWIAYIWHADLGSIPLLRELEVLPRNYLGLGVLGLSVLNLAWLPSEFGKWMSNREEAREQLRLLKNNQEVLATLEKHESRAILAYMYFAKVQNVWLFEEEFLPVRELQTKGFVSIERQGDLVNVIVNVEIMFEVVEKNLDVLLPEGETDIPGFVTAFERELNSERRGRYSRDFPSLMNYTITRSELEEMKEP